MSDYCEVSLGDYDGDEAAFYHESLVKLVKAHTCYECREAIAAGAHYHRVVGMWDGDVVTYKFCEACWEIMHEFSENSAVTFGVTWDTFESEWSNGASLQGCLNRLHSVTAKQLMTREWRKFKGIQDE